ncbi:lysophospholipid acyltransferase family protein [Leptospira sp. severe_002]|uniref:lysophospholipid acyltransferase family protein n=1 Tax=Leptospira sp. severe_002 TaxID=2838237 RepID=UPI001E59F58D|nr:lysophospholipid acyltransferase family protein [Leptospira sp. severe_002]
MRLLSSRRIARARWVQQSVAFVAASYLKFVWNTTRFVTEPADIYSRIDPEMPIIIAMWHGQHFLMPFIRKPHHRAKVLVSMHRDGEMNALTAERLGTGTIRGSGTHGTDFHKKGGVTAFHEMLRALEDGYNLAVTADVPKVSRVAGLGIVKLAQLSGRPIYPMAIATRRRHVLRNWDRSTINLPFSHGGRVVGDPIRVPRDADDVQLEAIRVQIEQAMNAVTQRAYDLAEGKSLVEEKAGGARG